jgi:uncharacterized protein YfaP (DUF2135 family)
MTRARDLADSADLAFDGDTLKIDTANNRVGIGTSSPASELAIEATGAGARFEVETTGSTGFRIYQDDSDGFTRLQTYDTTGTTYGKGMSFFVADAGSATSEVERILPSGKHLFGSTTAESTSEDNMQIDPAGGNIYMYQNTTDLQGVFDFRNPNGYIGSIRTTGSSTQFNTSSDYRLKENIDYTFDATTELKRLKPCKFNFIADADTTVEGFIAHEVAEVVPHAVSGEKDATRTQNIYDDEGNITGTETVSDYQQIDQSKLVPLLVKTIQELEARITALEDA